MGREGEGKGHDGNRKGGDCAVLIIPMSIGLRSLTVYKYLSFISFFGYNCHEE